VSIHASGRVLMQVMGRKGQGGKRRQRDDRGRTSTPRYTPQEQIEILQSAAEVGVSFNAPTE
jgi:hypothetical protein